MPLMLNATATRTRQSGQTRDATGQPVSGSEVVSSSFACAIQAVSEVEVIQLGRQRGQELKTLYWKASSGIDLLLDDRVTVTGPNGEASGEYRVQGPQRDEGGRGGRYLSVTVERAD